MNTQPIGKLLIKVFVVSALAAAFLLPVARAQTLSSSAVPKFVDPLPIPKTMPTVSTANNIDYYEVAAREKTQQILPSNFGATRVWTFGPAGKPASSDDFHYPADTILAKVGTPVRVKWINDLVCHGVSTDPAGCTPGNSLTTLLPINQEYHWANPAQVCDGSHAMRPDCGGISKANYYGPIPMVVHLHGIHAPSESDGIPEAWWLPNANNIPSGWATHGSDYCQVNSAGARDCTYHNDGASTFQYSNDQYPAPLFYHDHTLGITAENVYSGMVGFYLLHGGPNDVATLPAVPYLIPLLVQDKSFNNDGSLHYTPEGNMIVVNGKTWPYLKVEPRKYRFIISNGADSRFFALSFGNTQLNFTQVGTDQGYLPHPVTRSQIYMTPGERVDVVVDFSGLQGKTLVLSNDEEGGDLGKVMQIQVDLPLNGTDTSSVPSTLPSRPDLGTATVTRKVALFESGLGIVTGTPATGVQLPWDAPVTEAPKLNTTEVWEMYNLNSGEDHPMHLHLVPFQVVNREDLTTHVVSPPLPGETGFKDTVLAKANTITRVKAYFDEAGLFAWHCHISAHEDDQMMRPLCVVDPAASTSCAGNQ